MPTGVSFFPHRQMDMTVLEKLERIRIPPGLCCVEVCDLLCRRAAQVSALCASVENVSAAPKRASADHSSASVGGGVCVCVM